MDDNGKHAPSYQLDQEILNDSNDINLKVLIKNNFELPTKARGIDMTVEDVAGLPTCKYADRVQSMNLGEDDLAFLKGLRRRIKNRLASQNSRRRSMEHLRRLTRELRAVRAYRDDALAERRALLDTRTELRGRFSRLRCHVVQCLQNRSDPTEVPDIEPERIPDYHNTRQQNNYKIEQKDRQIFECRIEKLVQQSVNHMYREKICAKTVFLDNDRCEVLDLCVKEKRRTHGRKQLAPKRVAYSTGYDDGVLDLKIKKESQ